MVTCGEYQLRTLGGLVGYCLNNRILTVWELKRLFYCYYEANSFVSDFPHIDFF